MAEAYKMTENGKFRVPIECKWHRELRFDSKAYSSFESFKSNIYQLSSDDLGHFIVVEATMDEEDCNSVAVGKFGPVSLDIDCRKALDAIFAQGNYTVPVKMYDENEIDKKAKDNKVQFTLHITETETCLYMGYEGTGTRNRLARSETATNTISAKLHLRESTHLTLNMDTTGDRKSVV